MTKSKVFGKRRMLHAKISISLQVSKLSNDSARLLHSWMITHADDEGRLRGEPEYIKATVVPLLKSFTTTKISKYLAEMDELSLIHWWDTGTDKIIEFPTWDKHQSFKSDRFKTSDLPSFVRNGNKLETQRKQDGSNSVLQKNRSEENKKEINKSEEIADKEFVHTIKGGYEIVNPRTFLPSNDAENIALIIWQDFESSNPLAFGTTYLYAVRMGIPAEVIYRFGSEIRQDKNIRNKGAVFKEKIKEYLSRMSHDE